MFGQNRFRRVRLCQIHALPLIGLLLHHRGLCPLGSANLRLRELRVLHVLALQLLLLSLVARERILLKLRTSPGSRSNRLNHAAKFPGAVVAVAVGLGDILGHLRLPLL